MKYVVRGKDGELNYQSFGQVEQAWLLGFIDPDDEVIEVGKTKGRRAGSIPHLINARRTGDQVWMGMWLVWTMLGVAGATAALIFFQMGQTMVAMVIAFAVGTMLFRVTASAFARSKPHR